MQTDGLVAGEKTGHPASRIPANGTGGIGLDMAVNHGAIHDLTQETEGLVGSSGCRHAVAVEPAVHCCAFDAVNWLVAEYRQKLAREHVIDAATKTKACTGHSIPPSRHWTQSVETTAPDRSCRPVPFQHPCLPSCHDTLHEPHRHSSGSQARVYGAVMCRHVAQDRQRCGIRKGGHEHQGPQPACPRRYIPSSPHGASTRCDR